ncbi:hypothetical protein X777_08714 [Ooceraea biroi]|uniref:Uncharacterized protein n=1 Tax=Ooceraea biroi TaxID=2015173 RepID=A0A026W970_OOCBI|nr:hypothetical protein X777_08714 [Ooceraea biroi]
MFAPVSPCHSESRECIEAAGEGLGTTSRSQNRDHREYKSKCTSAIFGAGREVADRITARREIAPTYPNFHKVQDMKGFLGKYHRWSSAFLLRRKENETIQDVN